LQTDRRQTADDGRATVYSERERDAKRATFYCEKFGDIHTSNTMLTVNS